jgi:DNA-binding MarR family transcriptional regulator
MNSKTSSTTRTPGKRTPRSSASAAVDSRVPNQDVEESAGEAAPPVVLEDGVFRVENWLPYEFSYVANRVSATLAEMYQRRFGLTVTGWRVVAALGTHPGIAPKELAALIGVDQVNITRAVAGLAKLSMVTRRTKPADRRSISLRLSSKGQAAFEEVLPLARKIEELLIAPLSNTQVQVLRTTMAIIVNQATATLAPQSGNDA